MQTVYETSPEKVIIGMVGLPARGKSYISKKIYRYLNWLGFRTEVFNVGNYRRKCMSETKVTLTNDFFNPKNLECVKIREQIVDMVLNDLINYTNKANNIVAILDATNTTKSRRKKIADLLAKQLTVNYRLLWIQSICDDEQIIINNIRKIKIKGEDQKSMDPILAEKSFLERIEFYRESYEPLGRQEGYSYVKIINVGEGVQSHAIKGYLPEKVMSYATHLTISPTRTLFLVRHGQTTYNLEGRIGGNPPLSQDGHSFKKVLPKIFEIDGFLDNQDKAVVLTSTLIRTIETVSQLKLNSIPHIELRVLNEINGGICEEMTYDEITAKYPEISEARQKDKLKYRYPSGQSYLDLIGRLQPLICWLQRQTYPVIIIGHQAMLRCIFGYFFGIEARSIPYLQIPLHTVMKMIPEEYSFREEHIQFDAVTGRIGKRGLAKKKFSTELNGETFQQLYKPQISHKIDFHKCSQNIFAKK